MKPWDACKRILIGGGKNVRDPRIFQRLSLIAFFAWVGLGADGLTSSSNYGPQEAFLTLGDHRTLALFVALRARSSPSQRELSQIIELFPTGGGGYVVASKLLSPTVGLDLGLRARRRLPADHHPLHRERRRGAFQLSAARA